jgi:predicted transcriptional regulator
MATKSITVRLNPAQLKRLEDYSSIKYRTKTSVVSQALDEFFLRVGTEIK